MLMKKGKLYPDFKHFLPIELLKHIAVYFVQELAPSPSINMKFEMQHDNDINWNDLSTDILVLIQRTATIIFYTSFQCRIPG